MVTEHSAHETPRRLLGLWAHPGDKAYLSAGLLDRIRRAGGQVTVVALSDGEAGFPEDDPRPVGVRRGIRRAEPRAAMGAIGVHDVRFLGLRDGGVADAPAAEVLDHLAGLLLEVGPDVVVTFGPDGITGHADHVVTSRLATEAWRQWGSGELWHAAKTVTWLEEWRDLHDDLGVWMAEEPTGVPDAEVALLVELAAHGSSGSGRSSRRTSQSTGVAAAMGEPTYCRWIAQEAFRRASVVGAPWAWWRRGGSERPGHLEQGRCPPLLALCAANRPARFAFAYVDIFVKRPVAAHRRAAPS